MPNIKSSTDLRNNYNEISKFCHESREPVFITKNGQEDQSEVTLVFKGYILDNPPDQHCNGKISLD